MHTFRAINRADGSGIAVGADVVPELLQRHVHLFITRRKETSIIMMESFTTRSNENCIIGVADRKRRSSRLHDKTQPTTAYFERQVDEAMETNA